MAWTETHVLRSVCGPHMVNHQHHHYHIQLKSEEALVRLLHGWKEFILNP